MFLMCWYCQVGGKWDKASEWGADAAAHSAGGQPRRIHCASFSCKACSTRTSVIIVYTLSRRGFALTCEMETGIAVDILSCKLHLTIRNSMNLDIQHLRSSIWKYVKTKEPPCTEPYARWCERSKIPHQEEFSPTRLLFLKKREL